MVYKLCKGTEELQSVHVQNSVSHREKELILEGDKLLREIIRSLGGLQFNSTGATSLTSTMGFK